MPLRLLILLSGLLLLACREPAVPLSPPAGFSAAASSPAKDNGISECPDLPPFTAALDFPSRYQGSDAARDDENPRAEAEYRRRIQPINEMEREISKLIERYLETGDSVALDCAVSRLARWADASALQGEVKTHTGKSMRKWALGSLAAAYLRAKFSASQPLDDYPDRRERIESWFSTLAYQVVEDWDSLPREKINNHVYWAAWSVMAAAVAADERALFNWAIDQYRIGIDQIDEQGLLPNELRRDTRALFYHNYALPPLTMIAAFAEANGVSLVDFRNSSLDRLVDSVMRGMARPEYFTELTGSKQNLDNLDKDSKFTWLEPYCWLKTCAADTRQFLDEKRPLHNYRVGGDVTALFSNAPPARTPRAQDAEES